jgi:integrase
VGRKATKPIPPEIRGAFYLAVWDLAYSGHFYRQTPGDSDSFLNRFGSGSIVARRHGLTILWLTAMAGRFNELAGLHACDVDGHSVDVTRSKKGRQHSVAISNDLIACTGAWHRRVGQMATTKQASRERTWCKAMLISQYLLPSVNGGQLNCDVFNRDVARPLGDLFEIHLTSHCFRDTACQQAMAKVRQDPTLDVRAVQSLMGHKSITTTQHYLRKQQHAQLCLELGGES